MFNSQSLIKRVLIGGSSSLSSSRRSPGQDLGGGEGERRAACCWPVQLNDLASGGSARALSPDTRRGRDERRHGMRSSRLPASGIGAQGRWVVAPYSDSPVHAPSTARLLNGRPVFRCCESPGSRNNCLASRGSGFGQNRPWLGLVDFSRIPSGTFIREVHPGSEMASQNNQNKAK